MIEQIISHLLQIKMKTKLNLRPNDRHRSANRTSFWLVQRALTSLPLISLLIITVNCGETPISQHPNEVPHTGHHLATSQSPAKQLERDVKEFHLTSDFRAVKLRWSYEHSDANEPAAFLVRFCELTSWNVEIKCRQRDLRVDSQPSTAANRRQEGRAETTESLSGEQTPVIIAPPTKAPFDVVHQLDPPRGSYYETQIFDLRALTNYTFEVRVARFSHEPPTSLQVGGQQANLNTRLQAARRLGGSATARQELDKPNNEDNNNDRKSLLRVETKPFGAEATKCLHDVSEVVINTGRYFGGRISVEDSADPRCNIIGNKSSEQTSYLFRIEHDVCGSKLVDGNRIETMVLVHENKDILTHNTARFLVLCNFLQKSFTLRASISLPKVNGLIAPSRPAVITSLARKPDAPGADDESRTTSVLLGSMPGVYRARAQAQSVNGSESARQSATGAAAHLNPVDELETNTIEKIAIPKNKSTTSATGGSQELSGDFSQPTLVRRRNSNSLELAGNSRARSLALSSLAESAGNRLAVPQPVEVQSKVLFVERGADMTRTGRRHHYNRLSATNAAAGEQRQTVPNLAPASRLDTVEVVAPALLAPATQQVPTSGPASDANGSLRDLKQSTPASDRAPLDSARSKLFACNGAEDDEPQAGGITITNNHRVAGDYLAVSGPNAKALSDNNNNNAGNYSIKYSALARVDEYPLGAKAGGGESQQQQQTEGANQMSNLLMRVRSGRMRPVGGADTAEQVQRSSMQSLDRFKRPDWPESRMGEMSADDGADLVAETSNEAASRQQLTPVSVENATLAQNITSYLLKWSLKTLTNLAKKSIETLMDNEMGASANKMNETELLVLGPPSEAHLTPNSSDSVDEPRASSHQLEPVNQRQSLSTQKHAPETSKKRAISGEQTLPPAPAKQDSANRSIVNETARAYPIMPTPSPTTSTSPPSSAPIKEAVAEVSKSDEELLDGFITSSKRADEKHAHSKAPQQQASNPSQSHQNQNQNQHGARPSNYSKALDLSRVRALSSRNQPNAARNSSENASRVIKSRHQHAHAIPKHADSSSTIASIADNEGSEHAAPHWNESVLNSRDGSIFRSSWLFCSIALFVALITGIFLTFWLASAPSRRSSGALEQQVESQRASGRLGRPPIAFNNPTLPGIVFNADTNGSVNSACNTNSPNAGVNNLNDVSYQKYDYNKFDNYSNEAINNHKANLLPAVGVKMNRPSAQSPSTESQSTRSTSAGSTLLAADENDCKNNEFLYTGHVLLNTGSSLGESYA